MRQKTKWGLIGYGNFAKRIEKSFLQTDLAELNYIASRSFKAKDRLNNISNPKKFFNSYKDLINDKDIRNIYITTTNNLHKELILESAKMGKNIICEKPACMKAEDFSECISVIKKNNVFFMEGLMYLHHPQIFKTIEIIKNNEIGKIKKIVANFGYKIGKKFLIFELKKIDKKSRIFNPELGGGAIYDLGCYPLTSSLLFFKINGDSQIVDYQFKRDDGRYGVDENAEAKLHFNCGGIAEISVSIRKNLENIVEIFGTKGRIKIFQPWLTPRESKIELQNNHKKIIINNLIDKDIYAVELDKASKAIIENKKEIEFPGINLEQSLEYIKILEKWKSADIS